MSIDLSYECTDLSHECVLESSMGLAGRSIMAWLSSSHAH